MYNLSGNHIKDVQNMTIWNTQNCGNFEPIISFQISVGKCLISGFTIVTNDIC